MLANGKKTFFLVGREKRAEPHPISTHPFNHVSQVSQVSHGELLLSSRRYVPVLHSRVSDGARPAERLRSSST